MHNESSVKIYPSYICESMYGQSKKTQKNRDPRTIVNRVSIVSNLSHEAERGNKHPKPLNGR